MIAVARRAVIANAAARAHHNARAAAARLATLAPARVRRKAARAAALVRNKRQVVDDTRAAESHNFNQKFHLRFIFLLSRC